MAALWNNKTLKHLSLVDLNLGETAEQRDVLSTFFLYNETLTKINLSGNKLIKIKPLFQNLVRNCASNIQKLILSNNDYEVYDFN